MRATGQQHSLLRGAAPSNTSIDPARQWHIRVTAPSLRPQAQVSTQHRACGARRRQRGGQYARAVVTPICRHRHVLNQMTQPRLSARAPGQRQRRGGNQHAAGYRERCHAQKWANAAHGTSRQPAWHALAGYQDGAQGAAARRRHPGIELWSPRRPRPQPNAEDRYLAVRTGGRAFRGRPALETSPEARRHVGPASRPGTDQGRIRPSRWDWDAIGCVADAVARRRRRRAVRRLTTWCWPTGASWRRRRQHRGGTVLCAIEVAREEISAYGALMSSRPRCRLH